MSLAQARRARLKEEQEMNITAFMNLMVVLVPFLLITAVFSRMSVIELDLPAAGGPAPAAPAQTLELEVIVHEDRIVLADRNSGELAHWPRVGGEYDYASLREKLKDVKAQFPDVAAATVLLEPDTPYEVVVKVMDALRTFPAQQGSRIVQAELFPEISLGDAPL